MATGPQQGFYLKTTPVLEGKIDLPLVTLPAGTVLFRGQKLPNPQSVDPRIFYRDFLGDPEGSYTVCLNPSHNTFFYPFPYIAFGANDVGKTFDIMNIVVLVQPVTVVSMLSPSTFVRGTIKRYSGDAAIQRCSSLTNGLCHEPTPQELDAMQYDNCLNPAYQLRSTTRGWMAIAQQDSLNKRRGSTGELTSMGSYVKALESRHPGSGAELVAWSYTDSNKNYGFPEIALYPYKKHKGLTAIKRQCKNIQTAIRIMQKEAEDDNLNYLPIAAITNDGLIDMVNGLYTYERLGVSENAFSIPALNKQLGIENRLAEFLDSLQTKGINLPVYGNGKLSFDTRTGFYILPQVIPKALQISEKGENFPYRYLSLPLDTSDAKRRAMNYILMFRSFIDKKFMDKYGLDKGFGVKRAMIFERPPMLSKLFQELGLDIPVSFRDALGRASRIYKENTMVKPPTASPPAPAPAPAPAPQTVSSLAAARMALKDGKNISDVIGGYGKPINPYKLTQEQQQILVNEQEPSSPPYRPSTPIRGGSRRVSKISSNKTRKASCKKGIHHMAREFSKVWSKLRL